MIKVFISGPMSGYPEENRPAFFAEAGRQHSLGRAVLNPATLPLGLTQAEYMSLTMPMVIIADEVVLLPGWWHSPGSMAEKALAEKLGKRIVDQANVML